MNALAYSRLGSGELLVLIHGLGSSRDAWGPVLPLLASTYDVVAVDLPGFGESPALPDDVEPTPAALAEAVGAFLDDLGIVEPHVAGNSLGGWVALELAKTRPLGSLALLSPAGLWHGDTPLYCRVSLRTSRWLTHYFGGLLSLLARLRLGRRIVFSQTHGRPESMSYSHARATIRAIGRSSGFQPVFDATVHRGFAHGESIEAPVTVAFGERDRLLRPRCARYLDALPEHTELGALPECGHVPMSDNPTAVVAFIHRAAGLMDEHPSRTRGPGLFLVTSHGQDPASLII
jgi:pimeloyl-ACP methyl ester carboxylesterase